MGNLSTAMKTIILSGRYQVRQTYSVIVPVDAAYTGFQTKAIHTDGTRTISVIDHGVKVREGYNQTIAKPGSLNFGLYRFTVDNADGAFDRGAALWKHTTSSYQAEPSECKVYRFIAVAEIGTTSFNVIPGTVYTGKINRVEYKSVNIGVPKTASIFCEPSELIKLTGRTWNEDDFDNVRIGSSTFQGPLVGDN